MMLTETYALEPRLLGTHRQVDDRLEALGLRAVLAGRGIRQMISEAQETKRSHAQSSPG